MREVDPCESCWKVEGTIVINGMFVCKKCHKKIKKGK